MHYIKYLLLRIRRLHNKLKVPYEQRPSALYIKTCILYYVSKVTCINGRMKQANIHDRGCHRILSFHT